jgi:hypothetical protein
METSCWPALRPRTAAASVLAGYCVYAARASFEASRRSPSTFPLTKPRGTTIVVFITLQKSLCMSSLWPLQGRERKRQLESILPD